MSWVWSWIWQIAALWIGILFGFFIAMAGFRFGDPLCKRCGRDKL